MPAERCLRSEQPNRLVQSSVGTRTRVRRTTPQALDSRNRRHWRAKRPRQAKRRGWQQKAGPLVRSEPIVQGRQLPQLAEMHPQFDQATSVDRKPGESRKIFLARLLKSFYGEIVSYQH